MKEPHKKGIANHLGPESCADSRKAGREALTGVQAGWVLSREMELISGSRRCQAKRKTGRFTVMRKTIGKRMAAKLKAIKAVLRKRMHEPIKDTGEWLRAVVRGYYNYHAVPGNFPRMRSFRHDVIRSWWQAVRRRGQRVLR